MLFCKTFIDEEHINTIYKNIAEYNIRDFDIPSNLPHGYHIQNTPGLVDLNRFIRCFPKIHLKPGYTLDYILDWYGRGAIISIYARKETEQSFQTPEELYKYFDIKEQYPQDVFATPKSFFDWTNTFINQIHVEKSPEGLFDLALFLRTIKTIYLYDHDVYLSRKFIYTDNAIQEYKLDKLNPFQADYKKLSKQIDKINTRPYYKNNKICLVSETFDSALVKENISFYKYKPKRIKISTLISPVHHFIV